MNENTISFCRFIDSRGWIAMPHILTDEKSFILIIVIAVD